MEMNGLREAILFVARSSIRPALRQELKAVGAVEIMSPETADACIEALSRHSRAALVIDTEHGAEMLNQILRAAQGTYNVDTRPIFLIAQELSLPVVALGTEYNVSRLHTGEISRGAMQTNLEALAEQEADDQSLRSGLLRVANARSRGDWERAGAILMEMNQRFPDDRRVTCELVEHHIHEDQWPEARAMLEMANVLDQDNLRIQHLRARCLMQEGHFAEAEAVLAQAQLINPYHVERLIDLGKALMSLDRTREALARFEAALALDAGNVDARQGQASCRLLTGDVNDALALMRQLSGPRELAAVFNNAAVLAIRHGRFDQGIALYRSAIGALGAKHRMVARLLYNLGIACHKQGRTDEALDCFAEAFAADRGYDKARQNALAAAAKLGRRLTLPGPVVDDVFDESDEETLTQL
jgi:tetratricopeptide (TPR) repeat protein